MPWFLFAAGDPRERGRVSRGFARELQRFASPRRPSRRRAMRIEDDLDLAPFLLRNVAVEKPCRKCSPASRGGERVPFSSPGVLPVLRQHTRPDLHVPLLHRREPAVNVALSLVRLGVRRMLVEKRGVGLVLPMLGESVKVGRNDGALRGCRLVRSRPEGRLARASGPPRTSHPRGPTPAGSVSNCGRKPFVARAVSQCSGKITSRPSPQPE